MVVETEDVPLSKVKSIDTTWNWKYEGANLVTNVAYDVFTSATPGGSEEYEIMIWLGNFNAGPIARYVPCSVHTAKHAIYFCMALKLTLPSSAWGADGKPIPLATGIKLANKTWNLYKGPNGQMTVFSFLPADGKNISGFKADINVFLKYLSQNQGLAATQYLKSVGAGTEPTMGEDAIFSTSKYIVDVKYNP